MRRLIAVFALTGLLLALTAGSAFATVHPLACSERSADAADGTAADTQDPPGLTPGGPDNSSAAVAQPVHAVLDAAPASGGKSLNSFKPAGC